MKTVAKHLIMVGAAFGLLMGAAVANAVTVDLTVPGNDGYIGDAYFTTNELQPTGTGYINPFLRIQGTPSEQGYNTDGASNNDPWNDKATIFTHSLQLKDLVSEGGFYKFLLDINEPAGAQAALDLTMVRLFLGGTGNSTLENFSELGTEKYAFGASDVVHMNYLLNPGSGAGDVYMYIPTSVLNGNPDDYFTLYSAFNLSADGFEEWATMTSTPPPVPEPGTFLLLGAGFLGLAIYGKRRRNNI